MTPSPSARFGGLTAGVVPGPYWWGCVDCGFVSSAEYETRADARAAANAHGERHDHTTQTGGPV